MSDLSKITIKEIQQKTLYLKIERIHPDAPRLSWLESQSEKVLKENALFRIMRILEVAEMQQSLLYREVFAQLKPLVEEDLREGEEAVLGMQTELTELGSEALADVVEDIVSKVEICEKDMNNNWENGLVRNFNPYNTEGLGVPFVVLSVTFCQEVLEPQLAGETLYTAMSITCTYT